VPLRRAARHDGVFPIDLENADELAEVVEHVAALGGHDRPFDIVVGGPPGTDHRPYAAAGATWWTASFPLGTTVDTVRGVLRDGPPS
ncbi:MAG TPA: LLM class flavin-dependent oxidoreductase, partial [Mycobacteriales bacterium]|nr:LLM class flavin-dependent oxidoreductase [Mycobacteriales bacterium]